MYVNKRQEVDYLDMYGYLLGLLIILCNIKTALKMHQTIFIPKKRFTRNSPSVISILYNKGVLKQKSNTNCKQQQ